MTKQEEFEQKKAEYEELRAKVEGVDAGPVRLELKKRLNNLTGEIVSLRQALILDEVQKENPQNVPRFRFHDEPEHEQAKEEKPPA